MRVFWREGDREVKGWTRLFTDLLVDLRENAELVHLPHGKIPREIMGVDCTLGDCEILIFDDNKNILRALSFSDNMSPLWEGFLNRNSSQDLFVFCQYHNYFPLVSTGQERFSHTTGTYCPSSGYIDYDFFFKKRLLLENNKLRDKMFFMGVDRPDVKTLRETSFCSENDRMNHEEYLLNAINYRLGFSVAGVGDLCFRDIEYLAIGLPFLRLEFITQLSPALIPDYHYIAIRREKYNFPYDIHVNRDGGASYVRAYIERFLEVKDDIDFLNFVAKNGRAYYETYIHPNNQLNHVKKLLKL